MRNSTILKPLIGVDKVTITSAHLERGTLILQVRLHARDAANLQCSQCEKRCPRYDQGSGYRRWRALDSGTQRVQIEAQAPRVICTEHGVRVALVPWARAGSGFTRDFEDQVAWFATQSSKVAVTQLMRIGWRTVGRIISRVVADGAPIDRLDGLRRIGIDETSYRKGHRYLTAVVDHDTGHLVWAAPGHDSATLSMFFDLLGPQRSAKIELVSADAANWIRSTVKARCPNATQCMDPFHVVAWVTNALDEVRREEWRKVRATGDKALAKDIKGTRYVLLKNPKDLTEKQKITMASIVQANGPLHRAYLIKEQFRAVFQAAKGDAKALLDQWLAWVSRAQFPAFSKAAESIKKHRVEIDAVLEHRLSNARVESMNTKLKLISRRAFGFHGPEALIALAMLSLGRERPTLPGRVKAG